MNGGNALQSGTPVLHSQGLQCGRASGPVRIRTSPRRGAHVSFGDSSGPIEAETEHFRARSGPSLETRGARGHAPEPGPGHARAREAARATANPRRGPRTAGRDQEPGPPEGGSRAPLFLAGARQLPRRFMGHLGAFRDPRRAVAYSPRIVLILNCA